MISTEPQVPLTARLTSGQAAKALEVSKSSILNYIRSGALRASIVERNKKKDNAGTMRYRIFGKDLIKFWREF